MNTIVKEKTNNSINLVNYKSSKSDHFIQNNNMTTVQKSLQIRQIKSQLEVIKNTRSVSALRADYLIKEILI